MRHFFIMLVVCTLVFTGLIPSVPGLPENNFMISPMGLVNISAIIPDSPSNVIAFRIFSGSNDMTYFSVDNLVEIRPNVTSEAESPQVAETVLIPYGGLPQGAILVYNKTEYIETENIETNQIIAKYPIVTNVQYGRYVDNIPVVGPGGYINIDLGNNGELIYLNKVWRSVSPDGYLAIIPVSSAIEKLQNGEVLNPKKYPYNVNITKIRLGYYEKGRNESQEYMEPAWLFKGTTDAGEDIQYYVYARQFANFTATRSEVTMFKPVQFNDTSETTTTKWYWDFGDGTNSTEQNPLHLYKNGGNYTVNLTVWNDMGSDTISRDDYVHVYYTSPAPVAQFTSNYTEWNDAEYGPPLSPFTIQFTDQSQVSGNYTQWYWDFGDGTNSTGQNPVHTFIFDGNYWYGWFPVNLTVTDSYGRTSSVYNHYVIYFNPHVDFVGVPTSGAAPLNVTFTELPDGIPEDATRTWYFSDGSSYRWDKWSADWDGNPYPANISHVYSSPGNYTVSLFEEVGETAPYLTTKKQYITVWESSNLPIADFTANTTSGKEPLAVAFTAQLTQSPATWNWSFGDGATSTEENPVHVYPMAGIYPVSLNISNIDGSNTTEKRDYIHVYPTEPPVADFTANPPDGNSPLAVAFTDISAHLPVNWTWDFGDGSTSTEKNPEHIYAAPGNYTVSLFVMNDEGSNSTAKTEYIHVLFEVPPVFDDPKVAPISDFIANTTSGKVPLAVTFIDTSVYYPGRWNWSFGDSGTSTGQNPEHLYSAAGTYTVNLTAGNAYGENITVKTDYITVFPRTVPEANFTATPVSGKVPLTVVFNDTSIGSPTGWLWDFGDGITSPEQHPVHEYTAAGTYTVSLTAINDNGSDTETRPDYIVVTPVVLPVADFTVNSTSGQVPLAVSFTDTSSGTPTSWSWTFGDGGVSADQDPVHVYTTAGQFAVSLQVTNEDGSNTTIKEQFITGSTLVLPAAEFTANTTTGDAPLAVGFTDQSTGSPVSWSWAFGDGATSDEQDPSHMYTNTGSYTVSLEVTNPDGSNTATKTDYITVISSTLPPVAIFTGKPTCGKAPLTVKFNDTSTGSPTEWYWNFGDGTNAAEQNPVHVYTTAGKYTVSLTATNASGSNTSTRKDYITVSGLVKPPVANFYARPTSGKAPLSVTFTDASTGNPASWYWEFGDRTNATERNPDHTYTNPGKYTVSLTVTNAGGSNTKTRT
jgi:PKD repeat protein